MRPTRGGLIQGSTFKPNMNSQPSAKFVLPQVSAERLAALSCWLLWAYWLMLGAFACPFEDTVRDVGAALRIAQGLDWPSTGPVLANAVHVGPIWFYLLAPVVAISNSWLGVALFIAALAGLKFPLAFRLGSAVLDWRYGWLFALALLMPSWPHLQSMFATHTSVVETMVLAYLLLLHRYVQTPSAWRAAQVGLVFALALHAHPSALVLLPITAFFWLVAHPRYQGRPWHVAIMFAATLIPFLPYLLAQVQAGWPDLGGASGYVASRMSWRQLANVPALLSSVFWSGPHALIAALLPRADTDIAFFVWSGILLGSLIGLIMIWRVCEGAYRSMVLRALAVCVITLCTLCILRDRNPWYMAYLPVLSAAALLAAAWRAILSAWPHAIAPVTLAVAFSTLLGVGLDVGLSRMCARGEFSLPGAMADTMSGYSPPAAVREIGGTSLAARYAPASGRFLCAHPTSILHGSYAGYVDDTGALDARLACRQLVVRPSLGGGAEVPETLHWIGLPRRLWAALGKNPLLWIGPFGMGHAKVIARTTATLPVADADLYPSREWIGSGDTPYTVEFDAKPTTALIVSNVLRYTAPITIDEVSADGVPQGVLAQTAFVQLYRCAACAGKSAIHWRIRFHALRIDYLDVVGLSPAE
jgi:hypothetical protein